MDSTKRADLHRLKLSKLTVTLTIGLECQSASCLCPDVPGCLRPPNVVTRGHSWPELCRHDMQTTTDLVTSGRIDLAKSQHILLLQPSTATLRESKSVHGPTITSTYTPARSNYSSVFKLLPPNRMLFWLLQHLKKLRAYHSQVRTSNVLSLCTAPCIGALLLTSVGPALLGCPDCMAASPSTPSRPPYFLPARLFCDSRHHSLHVLITGRLQRPTSQPHRCLHLQECFLLRDTISRGPCWRWGGLAQPSGQQI